MRPLNHTVIEPLPAVFGDPLIVARVLTVQWSAADGDNDMSDSLLHRQSGPCVELVHQAEQHFLFSFCELLSLSLL